MNQIDLYWRVDRNCNLRKSLRSRPPVLRFALSNPDIFLNKKLKCICNYDQIEFSHDLISIKTYAQADILPETIR